VVGGKTRLLLPSHLGMLNAEDTVQRANVRTVVMVVWNAEENFLQRVCRVVGLNNAACASCDSQILCAVACESILDAPTHHARFLSIETHNRIVSKSKSEKRKAEIAIDT
jgi:hypothetical protein